MKQSRWAKGMWLPACVLATLVLWLGCEQKGNISPTSSNQRVLTFIDTVIVEPPVVPPGENAAVHARILSETNEPAEGENVHFTVNRGSLPNGRADTTVMTDRLGWARTSVTAPADTGTILLRTELVSMTELWATPIRVSRDVTTEEGVLTLWSDADTLYADNGTSRTQVHARLRNESHNPIPGAVIYFSTNVGSIQQYGVTDSIEGTAHVTLVSTTETGPASVVAYYGLVRDTVRVVFLTPAQASTIVVTSSRAQISAGSDTCVISARVFDANNLPVVDNTLVFFATTQGTLSPLSARTSSGVATSVLRASSATGVATVSATTGGTVSGSTQVTFMAGPTAAIALSASRDTMFADNSSEATITAYLTDAFGNPVSQGTPVTFSAYGGTVTTVATVGNDGRASGTFRAGLTMGPAAVTATQGGVQASVSIYLQPTVAASITLTVDPTQLVANGSAQANLRAAVLDAQSRPVSDGTPVTFYAAHGTVSGAAAAAVIRDPINGWDSRASEAASNKSASGRQGHASRMSRDSRSPMNSLFSTTTVGGYAYAILTSATVAGNDTITASVQALSAQRTATYVAGPPARINVIPAVAQLPADGFSATTVSCQVTDAFGNPAAGGVQVNVTSTLGQMIPSGGYTDPSGVFTTNLVSSRNRGLCGIVATTQGATGYGQVMFAAPAVVATSLTSNVSSLWANGISYATLTATALDEYGLPVWGETVNWSAGTGTGNLVIVSGVTDSLGRATALFYSGASRTDATRQITASVGGHSSNTTIRMLGITLQAWTDATQLPADGESTTNASVLIRETTSGQAVVGATVRFAATLGSIALTATTNSSGVATALYRSSVESGIVEITTVYGDTLRAQTGLRLTGIEAENLTVTLGQSELLADGVSSTGVTAVALNEGGQPVANVPVLFTAIGAGTCVPPSAVTNSEGVATTTYYSAALNEDRQVTVDAAIERDSDAKALLLRGVVLDAHSVDTELPANGSSTCQIRVTLRRSATLVAIPNTVVYLGTNLGTVPASVTTDASGVANATFTAGLTAGTATVVARFGNVLTDTVTITLFQPAATYVAVAAEQSSLLGSGLDGTLLSTLVLDQRGMALPNAIVMWSLSGAGSLYTTIGVTDSTGRASNLFTAPAVTNDVVSRVTVTAGGRSDTVAVATRGVTLEVTPDAASIPANGVAQTAIRAQLRETSSTVGITYATLQFGTTLGAISADMVTDEWGRATANLVAGLTSGEATVVCRYGNLLTDTARVTLYPALPDRVVLTPSSDLLYADGMSTASVRAVVYDAMNVVLQNVPITWSVLNGTLSSASQNTGVGGWADGAVRAPASRTDLPIIVTVNAGSASGTDTILARGISVNLSATPDMVIADGSSTSQIRAHVFETSTSVAIYLGTVTFGTTHGTIPNTATTDMTGIAAVTLRSAATTGVATVTASYGNILSDQTTVTFAPSTPTTLSLTASPTVLLADNISTSTLTAVVTDQSGNPVPNGTQVRFSIPPQSGSLENLRTTVAGVAINTLTSSSTPDTVQIVAWAEANPAARDSVTVIYRVGPPAVVTLSALRDTLPANGIAVDTITAHVTDVVGHVLANVEVQFSTTIGNITSSRVTDANGNAKVAFSSSQTGTAQVTAQAGTATGHYTVYLIPGAPNSISLEYLPSSVGVRGSGRNETLLITATVYDANNNPVLDGTPVYFNINSSPGGGDFLSSTGPIPTINGRATVSYNSGTRSGSVRIRALCSGITAVSTEILIYAGPPFIEDIHAGCTTSHMSLTASPCNMFGMDVVGDSVSVIALVGDRYNNPVTPGTAVYFTTSGGVITTATGYTDSAGFARVTLYSGNPLPTISRWMNTLSDPNIGGPILCSPTPTQPGVAKVLATSAGVNANGDSVTVWAATNVIFDYSQPILNIRSITVNGNPDTRTLYIGQNAVIRISLHDADYWPMVAGSVIHFSASYGSVYPNSITIGCPGDTTYTMSFFNNRTVTDPDAASPVLISVDTRQGDAFVFTETFTLRSQLPPGP